MPQPVRLALTRRAGLAALAASALLPARRAAAAEEVNVYTTREPGLLNPLLHAFSESTGIKANALFLRQGLAERVQAEGSNSPADLLITVDIGDLLDLVRRGLIQPIRSAVVEAAVPPQLRGTDGQWTALSLRARAILVSRERVQDADLTYESLADPRWRGKVCIRSGQHPYNTALFAAMIAHRGEAATEQFLTGLKANLARRAAGGDREVARDIMGGLCDIGVSNTYYMGIMLSGRGGAEQQAWGRAVRVILPRFADGGTHVNVSGAVIARHAPHRANAVKLLEYLLSPPAQRILADGNFEYPVRPDVPPHPILAELGTLKPDSLRLDAIAAQRNAASQLVDRVGFDR